MNSIYDLFGTDPEAEQKGIVIDYGDFGEFYIARAGGANSNFSKHLAEKMRPYRRQIDTESMDEKVAQRLMAEAFAETVILGWKGVKDKEGKELKFSKETCVSLLTDLPELFTDLREQSMKFTNFRKADVEGDAKN